MKGWVGKWPELLPLVLTLYEIFPNKSKCLIVLTVSLLPSDWAAGDSPSTGAAVFPGNLYTTIWPSPFWSKFMFGAGGFRDHGQKIYGRRIYFHNFWSSGICVLLLGRVGLNKWQRKGIHTRAPASPEKAGAIFVANWGPLGAKLKRK